VGRGPAVIRVKDSNLPLVVGVMSAYLHAGKTDKPLPGVAVISDVSRFHQMSGLQTMRLDDAITESPAD
jgi:hypothetical protein